MNSTLLHCQFEFRKNFFFQQMRFKEEVPLGRIWGVSLLNKSYQACLSS